MKKIYFSVIIMLLSIFGSGQMLNTASEEGRIRYEKLKKEQPELSQVKMEVDDCQLKSAAIVEVGDTTAVFNYTGSAQEFIVPNGVTQVFIEAFGAQGGHGGPSTTGLGGKGGSASGYLDVIPGQILYVYVGGQGQSYTMSAAAGGFNGGGGTNATSDDNKRPGCGGGASDVRIAGNTLADRVIVAGGGGGASGWMDANGGDGGGLEGQEGQPPYWWSNLQGLGGTQVAGGAGGGYGYSFAESGSFGFGGKGLGYSHGGGGGGGGWYGGGGGVVDAGGGGSSYIAAVSDSSTLAGVNTGDGLVKISWEYVCPDVVVDNDEGLCGALVTYQAPVRSEVVGIQIDASGLTIGDTFPVGVTVQQYEFDYGEGGKDTCTFTVTVNDTEAPVVECNGTGGLGKAAYVSSNTEEPWGESGNIDAMDSTFGNGNWDQLYYETVDVNTLLSDTYNFIFMEGGDNNANEMETFIDANISAIEGWVSAGGNLFLNAAPNEGDGMNWGFGGVQLNYGSGTSSSHVTATDPAHAIFTGPFTPVVTEYWGGSYSHASITEQLYTNVLINDFSDPTKLVLVSALWGQGKVFFGGMTTTNFHDPELEAFNLRANMLYFLGYNKPLQFYIGEDGTAQISVEDIHSGSSDNCGIDTMFLDKYVFSCDQLGENEVTLTVVDVNGNSSSCTSTVTIIDDVAPSLKAKSIEVFLDENGEYTLTGDDISAMTKGTVDNCSSGSDLEIGAYPVDFNCIHVGKAPVVQLVARDKSGNESKEWVIITVSDTLAPAFAAVEDIEIETEICDTVALIEYPEIVAEDNCEVELELIAGLGADGMFPIGTTTETWVATDAAGNTDTLSFDVVVTAGNDLPTLGSIADVTVDEDAEVMVVLTGISYGADCAEQELTVSVISSDEMLTNVINVAYTAGDTTGVLEIALAPDRSGTAEITVTVEDSEGGMVTDTFTLTVTPVNDAPFLVTPVADQTVHASYVLKVPLSSVLGEMFDDIDDETLTVTAVSEGTNSLPAWATYANDTLIFQPTIADTSCVNIVVTATDTSGATATDTFEVCVDGYPVSAGEIEAGTLKVQMYPNPTSGMVTLELSSGIHDMELSVMDISGRIVLRKSYRASERITFDMSGKVAGMYFVKMDIEGTQFVEKLIVKD